MDEIQCTDVFFSDSFRLIEKDNFFHLVREDERVTKEDTVLGPLPVMRNYFAARRWLQHCILHIETTTEERAVTSAR